MNYLPHVIPIENIADARKEMERIGCHKKGIEIMAPKAVFKVIKIKNLSATAANILKQDMLSRGGDAATSRGTIDQTDENTDVILFGTIAQYRSLAKRLMMQQFGLNQLAQEIESLLNNCEKLPNPILNMQFGKRTYLMGILNVTPDSFSDGGDFVDSESAISHAKEMISERADIIDVGGESTRPGAKEISIEEELDRVIPAISKLKNENKIISVDTRKSAVAEKAIKAGANIINDISGGRFDENMAFIAAKHNAPIIIMHAKGTPENMQMNPAYDDLIYEILKYFEESIMMMGKIGVKKDNIILDPGIGFGKTLDHNLEILNRLDELKCFGLALCIGVSRKSFIGKILNEENPKNRDDGTCAAAALAISKKVDIIRIHNIHLIKKIAAVSDAVVRR